MLTDEQKAEFWRDGAIVINGVIPADELNRLRGATDELSDELKKASVDEITIHLQELTTKNVVFHDLAKSPMLISRVASLLGPNLQIHHSKLGAKPAFEGKGGICWHQDFPFFPHTNTSLVAVMVMLDDSTPQNGCMYVVRGSHKLGPLDHHLDGWFTSCCQEALPKEVIPEDESGLLAVTPLAGGISIHHCLALHMSPPNCSNLPRRGLIFQYRASDAHALAGSLPPDCGWQVSGIYDGYVRCEQAIWKLPKKFNKPLGVSEIGYGQAWNQLGAKAKDWNPPLEPVSKQAQAVNFALPVGEHPSLPELIAKLTR
ncbi:MAG: phytanoyl-CoA dioxygenase family protein [Gammaproteobacteria bacterium]